MDSPEEEELFLLGFILLDDKKKNKNKKNIQAFKPIYFVLNKTYLVSFRQIFS